MTPPRDSASPGRSVATESASFLRAICHPSVLVPLTIVFLCVGFYGGFAVRALVWAGFTVIGLLLYVWLLTWLERREMLSREEMGE